MWRSSATSRIEEWTKLKLKDFEKWHFHYCLNFKLPSKIFNELQIKRFIRYYLLNLVVGTSNI